MCFVPKHTRWQLFSIGHLAGVLTVLLINRETIGGFDKESPMEMEQPVSFQVTEGEGLDPPMQEKTRSPSLGPIQEKTGSPSISPTSSPEIPSVRVVTPEDRKAQRSFHAVLESALGQPLRFPRDPVGRLQ